LNAAPTFGLIAPAVGALLVVIGVWLFTRGVWPRRVGQTAHCRHCDYILSGAQTQCPECGTVVGEDTVVRGERRRKPELVAGGAFLSLLGVVLLGLFVTSLTGTIDWNRYKPIGWLLRDLGNPSSSAPAWAEIQRRLGDGVLSESDQSALVDRGLQVQASGVTLAPAANVLDFIGQRYLQHRLTDEQANQFFAAALKVTLAVRPVVGSESRVPYSITGTGRGPAGWWLRMRTLECQVDDGPVRKQGGGTGGSFGGWVTTSTAEPVATPGQHRLRVRVELATDVTGTVNWDDNAAVAKRVPQDLFADFQVVDGQTPIDTEATPEAQVLARLLTPRLTFNPSSNMRIELGVDTAALPVDVAFDVFARFNGTEYRVGSVSFRKGAPGGYGAGVDAFPDDPPAAVDVVFRSSEAVARETMGLTRIWKGEIVIPNVPLRRPPTSSPATSR
jgi:hypothetical protein